MTSLFQQLTSSSSVAIFQHPHHLELPFHNSYVIVDIVSGTVIFWTELSSNKATLFRD